MKYPNVTLGQVEAVLNKLGGEEGVDRLLRGELTVFDSNFLIDSGRLSQFANPNGTIEIEKIKNCLIPRFISCQPFDPTQFLGEGWSVWKGPKNKDGLSGEEDIDPRSLALTEIDVSSILFETCLKEGEAPITGEEKLRCLKEEKPNLIRLDGSAFLGFWKNYKSYKENSALEFLYRTQRIRYFDFPGLILRASIGNRRMLYFSRGDDNQWRHGCHWLNYDCCAGNPSAVLLAA